MARKKGANNGAVDGHGDVAPVAGNGKPAKTAKPPKEAVNRIRDIAGSGKIKVELPPMAKMLVLIEGISPLVVHRFSDKASKAIKDKHTGRKRPGSLEARDPQLEYEEAFHRLENGAPGFPAGGVKSCIKTACADAEGIAMTQAKRLLWVPGQLAKTLASGALLEIKNAKPHIREDMVRQPPKTGTFVPRWRPEFAKGWQIEVPIVIKDTTVISPESVVNLLARGGLQVGIGEGRPEKDGALDLGMFRVVKVLDIKSIGYEDVR